MAQNKTRKGTVIKKKRPKTSKTAAEETTINLPEVSDIPGQEKIRSAGVPAAMADTIISSDDEEGVKNGRDILNSDEDDVDIAMGTEADVTAEDLKVLGRVDQDLDEGDDEMIRQEGLDDTDDEGDPLNEGIADTGSSGYDLDVPKENSNFEDEENEHYSRNKNDE